MEINITKVYSSNTKKDGTPLKDKRGNVFYRVGLKTQEHGDRWVNGFLYHDGKTWEGQKKNLNIKEEEYNGTKQLKFEEVRISTTKLAEDIEDLRKRVYKLELAQGNSASNQPAEDDDYPNEINPDDIPF